MAIIETHVAAKRYYNYFERIFKKTTIRVHLYNRDNVETKCCIDELPEGKFPLSIYTILSKSMNLAYPLNNIARILN